MFVLWRFENPSSTVTFVGQDECEKPSHKITSKSLCDKLVWLFDSIYIL